MFDGPNRMPDVPGSPSGFMPAHDATAAAHAATTGAFNVDIRPAGVSGGIDRREEPVNLRAAHDESDQTQYAPEARPQDIGRLLIDEPAGIDVASTKVDGSALRSGAGGDGGTRRADRGDETSESAEADEPTKEPETKSDGGDIPPPDDAEKNLADDDGDLPYREGRNELALSPELRDMLDAINRSPIERIEEDDGSTITLALDDQNRSRVTVEVRDTVRVATGLDIQVEPELQDLGIGTRLARATADELVRQGVDVVDLDITDEAQLRTVVGVFGNAVRYEESFGIIVEADKNMTHRQALADLKWYEENTEIGELGHPFDISGIHALVDMRTFLNEHHEYQVDEGEIVLDRCDFNKSWHDSSEEIYDETFKERVPRGEIVGEVRSFNHRLAALERNEKNPNGLITHEQRRNAQIVLAESFGNYEAHVRKKHPHAHYHARMSFVIDPDTKRTELQICTYFAGNVRPGLIDDINDIFRKVGARKAMAGQSRDEIGRAADERDENKRAIIERLEAQPDVAEHGDLTNTELEVIQQTGRGLWIISRATKYARCRPFKPRGGGFKFIISREGVEEFVEPRKAGKPGTAEKTEEELLDEWGDS